MQMRELLIKNSIINEEFTLFIIKKTIVYINLFH